MTTGFIVENAMRALLYEVSASPKPGLVDRINNGAHKDMDFYSFIDSSLHLMHYFSKIEAYLQGIYLGQSDFLPAQDVFNGLVPIGIEGEKLMREATGGVNTHKGAIYALGLLSSAAVEHIILEIPVEISTLVDRVSNYVAPTLEESFRSLSNAKTYGQRQYEKLGLLGARGEAYYGYQSVINTALPRLEEALLKGVSFNDAMVHALIALMSVVKDSNVIGRHNVEMLVHSQNFALEVLAKGSVFNQVGRDSIKRYDDWCIEHYISHGGCADLLAVAVFLHFLK